MLDRHPGPHPRRDRSEFLPLLKLQLEGAAGRHDPEGHGNQWRWTYEYPKENGGFTFDSLMLNEEDRAKAIASNKIKAASAAHCSPSTTAVPVGETVRVKVTASDVIHKFYVTSSASRSARPIPATWNETCSRPKARRHLLRQVLVHLRPGHAYMPIAVRVVSQERYAAWLAEAKQKFANAEDAGSKFAAASK